MKGLAAMKKTFCALIAIVLFSITLLCGCSTPADPAEFPKMGETFVQNMLDGDFAPVIDAGDTAFRQALTTEALSVQWQLLTEGIGEYEGVLETDVTQKDGYTIVTLLNGFPNVNLKTTFTFDDSSGKLSGLWTNHVAKPIEPKSTDSYEEIPLQVGKESPLDAILTLPTGGDIYPAAVLVHGSGANDMDETIGTGGNKPFADIAHGLAERGIATLRYNKRTNQYPDALPAGEMTIEYEVLDDAAAAYALLVSQEGIDASNVYIIGHSLGGMLAPKIVQTTDAKGYVSLAGSPRHLADIIYDQNAFLVERANASDMEKELALAQVAQMVADAKEAPSGETVTLGYSGNYWNSLNALDMPSVIQSLGVPVFIAQGSDDFQVFGEDYAEWQALLSSDEKASFELYEGLNHLFMQSNGRTDVSEYNPKGNVDGRVIEGVADFILDSSV